jgi:divalent metal cation (Fe/Co/Zn/Cd) transporter
VKNFKKFLGYLLLCVAAIWIIVGFFVIYMGLALIHNGPEPSEVIIGLMIAVIPSIIMIRYGIKLAQLKKLPTSIESQPSKKNTHQSN